MVLWMARLWMVLWMSQLWMVLWVVQLQRVAGCGTHWLTPLQWHWQLFAWPSDAQHTRWQMWETGLVARRGCQPSLQRQEGSLLAQQQARLQQLPEQQLPPQPPPWLSWLKPKQVLPQPLL